MFLKNKIRYRNNIPYFVKYATCCYYCYYYNLYYYHFFTYNTNSEAQNSNMNTAKFTLHLAVDIKM